MSASKVPPLREVPAMPPLRPSLTYAIKSAHGKNPPLGLLSAAVAYCYAQAAADRDGKRRRVFKDGDVWRIEVAP